MNPTQEALKDYLETTATAFRREGKQYGSFEEFLLKEAKLVESAEISKDIERDLRQTLRYYRFPIKACFSNCQQVVAFQDGFEYYEGYALTPGLIPVHHAWLMYKGVVVDVTWRPGLRDGLSDKRSLRTLIRHLARNVQEVAYWGLPVERKRVRIRWASRRAGNDFLWELISEKERQAAPVT
jgi:hypothetical protein